MVERARKDQQPVNRTLWQTVGATVILPVIPAIPGAVSMVVLLHTLLQTVGTAVQLIIWQLMLQIVGLTVDTIRRAGTQIAGPPTLCMLGKVKAKIAVLAAQSGLAQAVQVAGVVETIPPQIVGVVEASIHLPAFQQPSLPTTGRKLHLVVQLKRGQAAKNMLLQVDLKAAWEPLEHPQKVAQLIAGPVHHRLCQIVGVVVAAMVLHAPLMVLPLGLLLLPLLTIRASLLGRVQRERKANQQVRADRF